MKLFTTLSASAIIAGVVALPMPAATATASCADLVNQKIATLQTQMSTVQSEVANFSHHLGDVIQLLGIQTDTMCTMSDIDAVTSQLNSCDVFDQTDSFSVLISTFGLLPLIQSTLTTLNNKKPEFDQSILDLVSMSWLVNIDVEQLHSKTDALGAALQAKVEPTLQSSVTITMKQIDGWFNATEAVYANHPLISL